MKLSLNQRTLTTVLVIPSVVVIMVLAVLLYRWSNQVSEATTVRLADSLQMSMVNWHLNFFRELSDICLAMRVDSDSQGDLDQYARRFAEWRSTARYPDVVSHFYILKSNTTARPAVSVLDLPARRFVPGDLPFPLLPLREELRNASSSSTGSSSSPGGAERPGSASSPSFTESFFPPGGGLTDWRFEPNIPALVRPIDRDAAGWIVIELNRQVIQTRILPDLARRYFMGIDGLDYLIAVVAGTVPRELIYSSDPQFGAEEVADADGLMDVFGSMTSREFGSPIHVFHKLSANTGLSGLAASIGTSWFPLIGKSAADSDWQLIVRHRRGGALGAFVAEMHRRDLAIGFGVLFLLVVSMAMLIVASQRASRLARLQMDFVTAVSHELRTPLTIISSAAENIAHGVIENKQQITRYGSVIEAQAQQLSRLVEEILLFASTRENRQTYNTRPLEVSKIIDAALAGTAGLIEASQFTLELEIPSNLPRVVGDLSALAQCLQNLITNALKYGGGKRWIGIRASVHEAESASEKETNSRGFHGREMRVTVSDRGMGIEPADLPHIFEPFYRSSSAKAAQIHGTGLGLSLAKSIAEAMRGQLTVASQPGSGSAFTLRLPLAESLPDEN